MAEHTELCLERQATIAAEQFVYAQRWPNHCTHCDGWGGESFNYDPSPAGVSLGSGYMTDFEPCPHCYEQGHCPRCGGPMAEDQELFDSETPCRHCGFTEGTEGAPQQQECGCWFEEERQAFYAWLEGTE